MARSPRGVVVALSVAISWLGGCSETTDSLGYDAKVEKKGLAPLVGPTSYPNPFRDWLQKTEVEIDQKLEAAFQQLFHGAADTEAIYVLVGSDQALIQDIFHSDVRTEGVGLGMLIAVELDHRDEFDKLWRYAKSELAATGANEGYFDSICDALDGLNTMPCVDPYGMEQFAMALVFAHGRWKSTGALDYEADALELFDVMLHKEDRNGGVVDGVTNLFDAETELVFHEPKVASSSFTRPSVVIPAYYALWAQATGDSFFGAARDAGGTYNAAVVNGTTGLVPLRADLVGTPLSGWSSFRPEAYRYEINLVLDHIWSTTAATSTEADRLLGFFVGKGIDAYGRSYELDGTLIDASREPALVSTNGALAAVATRAERVDFVQRVWDQQLTVGPARYYTGLMHMLSVMVLGGRFRVY
jgi:oligosaccharide reducing-end xylanase